MLDLADPWARALASAHLDQQRVRAMIEAPPDPDGRPVIMSWAVPRRWACEEVAGRSRPLDEMIGRFEAGDGYVVVVIAGGGMSGFAMPGFVA